MTGLGTLVAAVTLAVAAAACSADNGTRGTAAQPGSSSTASTGSPLGPTCGGWPMLDEDSNGGDVDSPEGTRYVDPVFGDVDVTSDLVYHETTTHDGQPVELKLDIYEPAGDTQAGRPAVMWMFGGSWQGGDKCGMAAYAWDSAERGYVGVSIDYRLRPNGGDLVPAAWDAYEDALAAVAWLKDHATDYRINADAIVAAGYSAGAINAMHLLFAPGNRPRGPDTSPVAGGVAISGLSFVEPTGERPPAIMHHGTNDTLTPFDVAESICKQTRAAGNVCQFYAYEGQGHGIGSVEVLDRTAHDIFSYILIPLGYPEAMADEAA
jgi:acetyl esterase/lipase